MRTNAPKNPTNYASLLITISLLIALIAIVLPCYGQTEIPISAEQKYAQQKLVEATTKCGELQTAYYFLNAKIALLLTIGDDTERSVDCNLLDKTGSGRLVASLQRNNELVEEGHKEWVRHEIAMIGYGKHATREDRSHPPIPIEWIKQMGEIIQVHDHIVRELPVLKARVVHADDCLQVYNQTIDSKLSDLTARESDQIKACKSVDSYPPPKEKTP